MIINYFQKHNPQAILQEETLAMAEQMGHHEALVPALRNLVFTLKASG